MILLSNGYGMNKNVLRQTAEAYKTAGASGQ